MNKYKTGDKCKITDSIMTHLIGKIVTIKEFKYNSFGINFYDVTIDDMNNCPLVASERVLRKYEQILSTSRITK